MVFPYWLEDAKVKDGISLATPQPPKGLLQSLPSMLRITLTPPI